jgi:RHS repeat-associated protein
VARLLDVGCSHLGHSVTDRRIYCVVWNFSDTSKIDSFKYDSFGRRIYKSSSSATSVYAYDGNNLVEETNSSGSVVARYTQNLSIDEPLAMLRSSTTSYYEQDGVGSVTSLSSGAGALAQTYTFDSFGKQTAASGSLTNPFQYTARESDPETSLYYYRARYYDPTRGFISEDPSGFDAGINFYSYVENNSINLIDPSGLAPCLDVNKFVSTLNNNAGQKSTGWCGRAIGKALAAGGQNVGSHDGKNYGPYLLGAGFHQVSPDGYQPQPGDIGVIQPYPGGNQAGHAEGWNGTQWVSDFKQPGGGIYPGPGYRNAQPNYSIYRPTPCPPLTPPSSPPPPEQGFMQRILGWIGGLIGKPAWE